VRLDKIKGLFLFAVAIWIWMGYSIYSHSSKHIIKATIIQSKTPVKTIDDKIIPVKSEVLWIDKLYFPLGNELYYPTYGYLGYKRNFIIYFDSYIESLKEQNVTFVVYSDDGFRLSIDGSVIGEYPKDRPYRRSVVVTTLSKGKHHIRIKYFQGYGQLGIKVQFKTDKNPLKLFGTDLDSLKFIKQ